MANLRFTGRNIADTGTISASPALVSTLPESHLQTQPRGEVARTTSAPASQEIKLTWAANQTANVLAIARHNFSTSATVRLYLYSDAAWTTGIYDSTALTAFATTGLNTSLDVHTDADFRGLKNYVHYFAEQTTIRSAKIVIADSGNADGYVEASRLLLAKYIETTYNPPYGGVGFTPDDASVQSEADDGSVVTEKRYKTRRLELDLQFVPDADLDDLLAFGRYQGLDKDFLVDLYPESATAKGLYQRGIFKLSQLPKVAPLVYGYSGAPMTFVEA